MKKENFKLLMENWNDLLDKGQVVLPVSEDYIEEKILPVPSEPVSDIVVDSAINMLDKASACIEMAHTTDSRLVEMVKEICSVNGEMLTKCIELCMCACKCDRDGCCRCLNEICSCPNCAQVCTQCCGC